jgi:signal recognition particle subunit SEC65
MNTSLDSIKSLINNISIDNIINQLEEIDIVTKEHDKKYPQDHETILKLVKKKLNKIEEYEDGFVPFIKDQINDILQKLSIELPIEHTVPEIDISMEATDCNFVMPPVLVESPIPVLTEFNPAFIQGKKRKMKKKSEGKKRKSKGKNKNEI